MPSTHPKEFRAGVVAVARFGDAPIKQIARDFRISESWLRNWLAAEDVTDGHRAGTAVMESTPIGYEPMLVPLGSYSPPENRCHMLVQQTHPREFDGAMASAARRETTLRGSRHFHLFEGVVPRRLADATGPDLRLRWSGPVVSLSQRVSGGGP